jgi:hypothetical protein
MVSVTPSYWCDLSACQRDNATTNPRAMLGD